MKSPKLTYTSFKSLKEAVENNRITFVKTTPAESVTDDEVFFSAMSDVRQIKEFRDMPPKKPLKIKNVPIQKDDSLETLRQIISGERKIKLSDTGEYIEWVSPHVRKDIVHRLHQGSFSIQDSIDLHGMTLNEAEEAFCSFFKEAVRKQLFCVKVIHGRGLRSPNRPVLKEALKKWLHGTFRKSVLAYSTARDCDGGLGATYIILRSR